MFFIRSCPSPFCCLFFSFLFLFHLFATGKERERERGADACEYKSRGSFFGRDLGGYVISNSIYIGHVEYLVIYGRKATQLNYSNTFTLQPINKRLQV